MINIIKGSKTNFIRLIALVMFLVLLAWGLNYIGLIKLNTKDQTQERHSKNIMQIDAVSSSTYKVDNIEGIAGEPVAKMPELYLDIPDRDWFTNERMQWMGYNLGLTPNATIENFEEDYMWQEQDKTLVITPSNGLIQFSTALNTDNIKLPETLPTSDLAKQSLQNFFQETDFPTSFYDLSNLRTTFWDLDRDGRLIESSEGVGKFARVDFDYVVSGVKVLLPVSSFIIVDGSGQIKITTLLILNIKQTERMLDVVSLRNSSNDLTKGIGVLIDMKADADLSKITLDSYQVSYYLNLNTFYNKGQRRLLTPIYIFEGEKAKIGLLATE